MSGSDDRGGGGGFGGGAGGGGPEVVDCADLQFITTLASPDLTVLPGISEGDVLSVDLNTEDDVSVVAVSNASGDLVGTVVSDQARRLRECLQRGQRYQAVVISIDGAAVQVEISAAG